ncbi:MAG: PPK2 family polyphosphate kinase [Flavobacteriales bacterium]
MKDLAQFRIDEQGSLSIKDHPTRLSSDPQKKDLKESVEKDRERIAELQELLYAGGTHSVLLVFQAMDAAGKDSCIGHVMKGVNPEGCRVWSFKAPNSEELAHDFLWRHAQAIPARGQLGVHNRSHYEEVLVVKVHPEYLLAQNIPGVDAMDKVGKGFWETRYASIRQFEEHLAEQGVVIMKFFLNMSKDAQKARLLERIDDPAKNWKFKLGDVKERALWDTYQEAYVAAINATAAPHAPWFVVPADEQWETRAIVAALVRLRLEAMGLKPPTMSAKATAELEQARKELGKAEA